MQGLRFELVLHYDQELVLLYGPVPEQVPMTRELRELGWNYLSFRYDEIGPKIEVGRWQARYPKNVNSVWFWGKEPPIHNWNVLSIFRGRPPANVLVDALLECSELREPVRELLEKVVWSATDA